MDTDKPTPTRRAHKRPRLGATTCGATRGLGDLRSPRLPDLGLARPLPLPLPALPLPPAPIAGRPPLPRDQTAGAWCPSASGPRASARARPRRTLYPRRRPPLSSSRRPPLPPTGRRSPPLASRRRSLLSPRGRPPLPRPTSCRRRRRRCLCVRCRRQVPPRPFTPRARGRRARRQRPLPRLLHLPPRARGSPLWTCWSARPPLRFGRRRL